MFPFKTIAAGVLLLLLAIAGLVYVIARPKPLIQSLQPEELPASKLLTQDEPPSANPSPEPSPRMNEVVSTVVLRSHIPRIKTFSVNLLSPAMAETFVAPATVTIKASANPLREVRSVEFYKGPLGMSVCQSLNTPQLFEREKIGEAFAAPYEFTWTNVAAGNYNIIAVATYEDGEQQLSDPTVIIVNKTAKYPDWEGWRPPYNEEEKAGQDLTLMPEPTPTPSLADCPTITVKSVALSPSFTGPVTFKAEHAGSNFPSDATYTWTVSHGRIIFGEGTPIISVDVDRVLDKQLVAAVEVGPQNAICPNTAFASVKFVQPSWMNETNRNMLLEKRQGLDELKSMSNRAGAEVYLAVQGSSDECVDHEALKEARMIKRYLVEVAGFNSERVFIKNAGKYEEEDTGNVGLWIRASGDSPPDWLADSMQRPLTQCKPSVMTAVGHASADPNNRTCPDLDEDVAYDTHLSVVDEINTCPYNTKDPQNTVAQLPLRASLGGGTHGNRPSFQLWSNGGTVRNDGQTGIWDLSNVKLRPGVYTAISRSDDGCDCKSVNTTSVNVTNFCTPCLTLTNPCGRDTPLQRQYFFAHTREFALAAGVGLDYYWTTSKGRIAEGQGTSYFTVDTSNLVEGEEFEVTVRVKGLQRYCVNRLSIKAIVGKCEPRSALFDEYGNINSESRRARRRPPIVESTVTTTSVENGSETTTPPDVKPKLNEKEWMKVSWAPRVKTDESFSITVTYNRTNEAFEVSSAAGEISEELKLSSQLKSLKEKFGPDYHVLGAAKLVTAGLTCNTCNQEQYQSLESEKVEWSWPVSPLGKGTQVFNVELWVKAEPRDKQSGRQSIAPEKVWSRNNLKVEVSEPFLTKTSVFAGGGLCAVLGLGLCVRGLKVYRIGDTYNVGQAVAVGRNVTMNNTTVNQQAENKNAQPGENNDA